MGADGNLLQGEVNNEPGLKEKDVENFLMGFLEALLKEQTTEVTS